LGIIGNRNRRRRKSERSGQLKRPLRKPRFGRSKPDWKPRRRRNAKRRRHGERQLESWLKKRKRGRRRNAGGGLQRRKSAKQNASVNVEKKTSVSRPSAERRRSGSARSRKSARRDWQQNVPPRRNAKNAKRRNARRARRARRKRPKSVPHPRSANNNNSATQQTLPAPLPSSVALRLLATVWRLDHRCSVRRIIRRRLRRL
jgi:hypothetical protein